MGLHLRASQRMAFEGEDGEARELPVALGERHEGAGEIGDIGEGMSDISPTRPGEFALRKPGGDDQVEPDPCASAIEIAGAQRRRRHAIGLGRSAEAFVHGDADRALLGRAAHRRLRPGDFRNLAAVIVDIAGEEMKRAVRFRRSDDIVGKHRAHLRPVGIERVQPIEDHVGAGGGGDQLQPVERIGRTRLGAFEAGGQAAVAGDGEHAMAGGKGCFGDGVAEATAGAENGDGEGHGLSPSLR